MGLSHWGRVQLRTEYETVRGQSATVRGQYATVHEILENFFITFTYRTT